MSWNRVPQLVFPPARQAEDPLWTPRTSSTVDAANTARTSASDALEERCEHLTRCTAPALTLWCTGGTPGVH